LIKHLGFRITGPYFINPTTHFGPGRPAATYRLNEKEGLHFFTRMLGD